MAKVSYESSGVSYASMDPVKKIAQQSAKSTSSNLNKFGFNELSQSRGDSAYVWDEGDSYRAFVMEGLGTKNLVADQMRRITGKTYYDVIAQDVVAASTNDLLVVGAQPMVVNAFWGIGKSEWLDDEERTQDLIEGWTNACNLAGAVWGGGETPTHKGIVYPDVIDLGSACVGIIKPKERLTLGGKIKSGDSIILIESSGIHANGLTLARKIAENLPEGYATKLKDGRMYGEALLTPSHIYAKAISELFDEGINIHYMVHITGHGFRKIMRAKEEFCYIIEILPEVDELFKFIQTQSEMSDEEMYGTFNMGAGFAVILPEEESERAAEIITNAGFKAIIAGKIETGEKQVVIKPLNITFKSESLNIR
jgi:phosphoribosylformylglycinamidine cyclo-ligase